jgi:magnesium transporter
LFIGTSFVLKTDLLKANSKYNEEAGDGYGYLKNAFWWTGMILMIVGEICNFVHTHLWMPYWLHPSVH